MKRNICFLHIILLIAGLILTGCSKKYSNEPDFAELFTEPQYSRGNMTGQTLTL